MVAQEEPGAAAGQDRRAQRCDPAGAAAVPAAPLTAWGWRWPTTTTRTPPAPLQQQQPRHQRAYMPAQATTPVGSHAGYCSRHLGLAIPGHYCLGAITTVCRAPAECVPY